MVTKSECQVSPAISQATGRYCQPFIPLISLLVTCILFGWLYQTSGQETIIVPFWLLSATIFTFGCMLSYLVELSLACDVYPSRNYSYNLETDFLHPTKTLSWLQRARQTFLHFFSPSLAEFEESEKCIEDEYPFYSGTGVCSQTEPRSRLTMAAEPASYRSLGPDYNNGSRSGTGSGSGNHHKFHAHKGPKTHTFAEKISKTIANWFHPLYINYHDGTEAPRVPMMPKEEITCNIVKAKTPVGIRSAELNKFYCDPIDNRLWRVVERRVTRANVDVEQYMRPAHQELEDRRSIDECAFQIKVTAIVCVLVTLAVLLPLMVFSEEVRNIHEAVARQLEAGFDAIKSYFV